MTSSPDRARDAAPREVRNELPPALSSMWRLCKLGYRHEPALMLRVRVSLLSALPDALMALWFKLLGEACSSTTALLLAAAMGLGVSSTATWFLRTVSTRVQRRFRDKVTIALESHVARLLASIATIAHHERPDHLDRLSVLRNQIFVLDHMYMSVFATCGWILRLGVTVVLLASIHPALVLLAVFAVPTVITSTWRPAVERVAQERGAQSARLSRHLFTTATTAAAGKEVRCSASAIAWSTRGGRRGSGGTDRWRRPAGDPRVGTPWRGRCLPPPMSAPCVFVATRAGSTPGDVLLVLAAGSRLSAYIGANRWRDRLPARHLDDGSVVWRGSRTMPRRLSRRPTAGPPTMRSGIRLDRVSFAYPGTSRVVLDEVSLFLPAGAVVAVVGENGAGKTTLVKLLAKMYEPTSGAILVDETPLARVPADEWRARLAGAFQDFFRFEFRARHTVGLGDVPRMDDEPAVVRAIDRAGASDLVARLPSGLDTQLVQPGRAGSRCRSPVAEARWRALHARSPLCRARRADCALDAETEHALFERYATRPEHDGDGRITLLVSHRFSTCLAVLIVVLDGARLVEMGSHDELMANGGQYSQLYASLHTPILMINAYR